MRELNVQEINRVSGGFNDWQAGGMTILGMSSFSPVTMAFGYPVGGAMLALGTIYR
ncbi:MAG: hypothetical protein HLX50_01200 [Alteromonadaceae bacterium]|nr:hypothetical protein [Alteromonadaceae bacterium]